MYSKRRVDMEKRQAICYHLGSQESGLISRVKKFLSALVWSEVANSLYTPKDIRGQRWKV